MKKLLKILNLGVLNFLYLSALSSFSYAQINLTRFGCFREFASALVSIIVTAIGIVSLFAVAIGGVKYMTSGGDKYKLQDAQGAITGGIIGLVLALTSWLIVNLLFSIFTGEGFTFRATCPDY